MASLSTEPIVPDFSFPPEFEQTVALERLARLRQVIAESDLGAVILFDAVNIRYACGVRNMQINTSRNPGRYVFVPAQGPVVLFEYTGCNHLADGYDTVDEARPARPLHPLFAGAHHDRHVTDFVAETTDLMDACGGGRRIGIERAPIDAGPALTEAGFDVVDATKTLELAKMIKSDGEIDLMRASVQSTEAAVAYMEKHLVPGRTENQVWASLHHALITAGGEYLETRLFNSGPRTNPWFQETSNRVIEDGDLVALDTDAIGCNGYYTDFSRTFIAGDNAPTATQRHLYQTAYEQLEHNCALIEVGLPFAEFVEQSYVLPDEYTKHRYMAIAHGNGLTGEHPVIPYRQDWDQVGEDGVFASNMVICVESFVGSEHGGEGVKLEEQLLLRSHGTERMTTYPFESRLLANP